MKKKHLVGLGLIGLLALASCGTNSNTESSANNTPSSNVASSSNKASSEASSSKTLSPYEQQLNALRAKGTVYSANLSSGGVVDGMIGDFKQYENTDAYVKVSTAAQLIKAIEDAKYEYTNDSINDDGTINQTLTKAGTVHVIEITNDLDLGYNVLTNAGITSSIVKTFDKNNSDYGLANSTAYSYKYDEIKNAGIAQICIENTSNLLIYSKNGAKIKHAGFKLTSDYNVVVRNLNMDEIWMWEDANRIDPSYKIGDYDCFAWAYFKISFSEAIWIDHCTFGKSYDGQIDVSNPVYNTTDTLIRAPFWATSSNGTHISYCDFKAGSSDEDGYIYKMMNELEQNYLQYQNDNTTQIKGYYYKTLRDAGLSFEDIMNGYALPQKKGFLLADSGDNYNYNKELKVSFSSCTFKNIEDRLPKLRSGITYVYNCHVDNSEYYSMLSKMSTAYSAITAASSNYKTGGVSQGVLSGLGGSVYLESSVYTGVKNFIKNNDTKWDTSKNYTDEIAQYGGYKIVNSYFYNDLNNLVYGSSSTTSNTFDSINASPTTLLTDKFSYHTADETMPFTIVPYYKAESGYVRPIAKNYNQLINNYFETEKTGAGVFEYDLLWTTVDYR